MENFIASRATVSSQDQGPYIVITSYILMSVMVLCTLLKLRPSRHTIIQPPRLDDYLLLLAMTLAIAENGLTQVAVDNGLGKHQEDLQSAQANFSRKMIYVSNILAIAILCLSKLSIFAFIALLTITVPTVRMNRLVAATVALWGLATLFAVAFSCELPLPWTASSSDCIDQLALSYSIDIFSIITDLLAVVIPIVTVWKVRIGKEQKGIVIAAFSTRLIVCAASIVHLTTLSSLVSSIDDTYNSYAPVLWRQIILNLSITTAAIPSLRPIFVNLQTGLMNATVYAGSGSSATDIWTQRLDSDKTWKLSSRQKRNKQSRPTVRGEIELASQDER